MSDQKISEKKQDNITNKEPNNGSNSNAGSITSFSQLNLSPAILKAVEEKGYLKPSPIQAEAIPAILTGKDVMAAAQTGTGKTAGFTLPILEKLSRGKPARANHVRALVISPTRELALQILENVHMYSKYTPLKSAVVYGGANIRTQITKLRQGVDILVATPGRLLDLHGQNAVNFQDCQILVLDEADRMLDMGFINDIRKIINLLPKKRQNLLFSATFSTAIRQLAKGFVHHAIEVSVSTPNTTAKTVKQSIIPVDKKRKTELLIHLIKEHNWYQVLVFSRTKHGANKMAKTLQDNDIRALPIHGNKSQNAREKALKDFKNGKVQVLVATDIAARGIDIEQLPHVINVDLPNVPEDYIHRIGRTGRAESKGEAVSLVSADEDEQLRNIERMLKHTLKRTIVGGFEPIHDVPVTDLTKKHAPRKSTKPNSKRASGGRAGDKTGGKAGGAKPKFGQAKPRSGNRTSSGNRRSSPNNTQRNTQRKESN